MYKRGGDVLIENGSEEKESSKKTKNKKSICAQPWRLGSMEQIDEHTKSVLLKS